MSKLKILLYSICCTKRIAYEDADGVMNDEIENTYLRRCHVDTLMNGGAKIEVSQQTRDALQELETKYDISTKHHIRKLRGFISKMADGDYFYFFNEDKTSVVERRTAMDCINAVKFGLSWSSTIYNKAVQYYSIMNTKFTYLSYGYDGIEEFIGEEDEKKRICRFCGKSQPEVTFNKVAHAIQEALGNKLLVCYEECDTCNHDLALTEDNFRYLMDFRRAMYHIPRKGSTKTPTVIGKSFIIKSDCKGAPELYLMEEYLPDTKEQKQPFVMHLELKTQVSNERMFKALCKMVIDMLPSKELVHFENTIKWITSYGYWVPDILPSALLTILPSIKQREQPIIDIYINNREQLKEGPYCTAIVWLYDVAYMFIVPLVDVDGGRYKYDEDLRSHWKVMSDLIGIHQWQLQDTSNYRLSTPWVNWRIDLSMPNIHVLPKSDSIFEKCLRMRASVPDIGMPDFKSEGITVKDVGHASFTVLYEQSVTDDDLKDITQHIKGPSFVLAPKENVVCVRMQVEANDTTDKISYFKFSYAVDIEVNSFNEYIDIKYSEEGDVVSFAFHYKLRDYLFVMSLVYAEQKLLIQRVGTKFEKCSLDKMLINDRLVSQTTYFIPCTDGKKYLPINDREIHGVGYFD